MAAEVRLIDESGMRASAERYNPEAAASLGQEIVGLYHRYAYSVAASHLRPGDRVLDVGFGEGYGAQVLASTGAEYVGVEVDPDAVEHARQRYGDVGDFRLYDGASLPEERFDVGVCFQVVEHLEQPEVLVAEISRTCDRALFTTPNRVLRLQPGERPWNRHHVREYAAEELHVLLRPYFGRVEVFYVNAPQEIEALELARLRRARRLARLDVLGLRHRLPHRIDGLLRKGLRAGLSSEEPTVAGLDHELSHTKEPGLDLLAIAEHDDQPRPTQRIRAWSAGA